MGDPKLESGRGWLHTLDGRVEVQVVVEWHRRFNQHLLQATPKRGCRAREGCIGPRFLPRCYAKQPSTMQAIPRSAWGRSQWLVGTEWGNGAARDRDRDRRRGWGEGGDCRRMKGNAELEGEVSNSQAGARLPVDESSLYKKKPKEGSRRSSRLRLPTLLRT